MPGHRSAIGVGTVVAGLAAIAQGITGCIDAAHDARIKVKLVDFIASIVAMSTAGDQQAVAFDIKCRATPGNDHRIAAGVAADAGV